MRLASPNLSSAHATQRQNFHDYGTRNFQVYFVELGTDHNAGERYMLYLVLRNVELWHHHVEQRHCVESCFAREFELSARLSHPLNTPSMESKRIFARIPAAIFLLLGHRPSRAHNLG